MAQRARGVGGKGSGKAPGAGRPRPNGGYHDAYQGGAPGTWPGALSGGLGGLGGLPQPPWPGQQAPWWPDVGSIPPPAGLQLQKGAGMPSAITTTYPPPMAPPMKVEGAATASTVAATTESVLDALAAVLPPKVVANSRNLSLLAEPRLPQAAEGLMGPEKLLGHWVDSQGNGVHVLSMDAYDVRLTATLSRPPRADIHLAVKPVVLGGGWQCGHSLLDPVWSSDTQLHWVAQDGRVSVWVRPLDGEGDDDGSPTSAGAGSAEVSGSAR